MQNRLEEANLPPNVYLPLSFQNMVSSKLVDFHEKLKSTHLLMLNGEKDELVRPIYNQSLVDSLRKIHVGKEGYDWKFWVVPGVGHEWCPEMIESSVDWTYRWMVKNNENLSKL